MPHYINKDTVGLTDFEIIMCDGDYKNALKLLLEKIESAEEADVVEVVRCCECVYHDDESQYHYCHKWRRNCPNDSDFFCKWGRRKDGGQDE